MKSKLFAAAVLLLMSVSGALGAPSDYVDSLEHNINRSERVDYWTCYDYSVDFEKNNPDWDCVTISNHRFFYSASHMVNYHFWLDGTPCRNYRYLLDNRGVLE